MKKIFLIILPLFCLLCSCTRPAEYREPEQVIITSALGFDNINGELSLCAETVKTGQENGSYTPKIVTGKGNNVSLVLQNTSDSLGGELFLGHCTTVVLGNSLTQSQIKDILSFLQSNPEISLSVKLVCTDNAKKALSSKTYSSEAVGYDILKLLTTKTDTADNKNYANLYSIALYKESDNPCFTLPYFSVTENENEQLLYPNGAAVYYDNILVYKLSSNEEAFFKILSNNYLKGILKIETQKGPLNINVEKSRCKINTNFADKALHLTFNIVLYLKESTINDISTIIENECLNFIQVVQTQIREDIFHICDTIKRHNPVIYKKIANQPLAAFLNAEILVQCKIIKGED